MTEEALDCLLISLGMHPDCIPSGSCFAAVERELEDGLNGNAHGTMMLPTYLSADGSVPLGEKIIVMDAGGTNLRRAVAHFDESGRLVLEHFQKQPMPGTQGTLSLTEFFDALAEALLPVIGESSRIGFCFSYPTEALPDLDGRLIRFCKEVRVAGSEGVQVCAELQKALFRKGVTEKKHFVLLNDSVAALLGGKAVCRQPASSWVGCIYGTGMNVCYIERTEALRTVRSYTLPSMIVNTEAGACRAFPAGLPDRMLDAESEDPGGHLFEKMLSGAYLGRLMALTAQLCAEHGAFSPELAALLREQNVFPLQDVGAFLDGAPLPALGALSEADAAALRQIFTRCYARAAKLVLILLGAILRRTGCGAAEPVCITMEGTTFRRSRLLRELFFSGCREYLKDTLGISAAVFECDDTTLTGTAIAGLLN